MTEDIYESDKMKVTSFYGGTDKGRCLQFTAVEVQHSSGISYAQLTKDEVKDLIKSLEEWMT